MIQYIVCLANSSKNGARCFAGKDIRTGKWIRPVSRCGTGEIHECTQCYRNSGCIFAYGNCVPDIPEPLDIVGIDLADHVPSGPQIENYTFNDLEWKKTGEVSSFSLLDELTDAYNGALWIDGFHSQNGLNDRIPERLSFSNSLTLIRADEIIIRKSIEKDESGLIRHDLRGRIKIQNKQYNLKITDKRVKDYYRKKVPGEYRIMSPEKTRLCISVGNVFQGFYYKLIAGIMRIKN